MPNDRVAVKVVSPEGVLFEAEADFVKVPSVSGELGILPDHSSTVAQIVPGHLRLTQGSELSHYFISQGFVHITPAEVLILTPFVEEASAIDANRAQEAKKRAKDRLSPEAPSDVDRDRAHQSFLRAEARIFISELLGVSTPS